MRFLLLNDTTLKAELLARGHAVRACGPEGKHLMPDQDHFDFSWPLKTVVELDAILERLRPWVPDVIVQTETHTNYFYRGIERAPCPTLWRTIDNHIHTWQPRYAMTHDLVLVAQKDYLSSFQALHPEAHWLPLSCFPALHYDRGLARTIPASFVGSLDPQVHPERARFFDALRLRVPVEVHSGLNQVELADLYNRSRIVVNQCVHRDLNYRVYEALSNGALLITPAIENGQSELFVDGQHLVTYPLHDAEAAAAKVRYYLEHDDERKAIARAGYDLVHQEHSLSRRLDTLLELLESRAVASFARRPERLSADAWLGVLPLYAALHMQRYGSAELAVDALRGLAEVRPEVALGFLESFAQEHLAAGRAQDALAYLVLAEALGKGDDVADLLGRVRLAEGRLDEALPLLARGCELRPGHFEPWYYLGLCWEALDNLEGAGVALRQADELAPGNPLVRRRLERLERLLGEAEGERSGGC